MFTTYAKERSKDIAKLKYILNTLEIIYLFFHICLKSTKDEFKIHTSKQMGRQNLMKP